LAFCRHYFGEKIRVVRGEIKRSPKGKWYRDITVEEDSRPDVDEQLTLIPELRISASELVISPLVVRHGARPSVYSIVSSKQAEVLSENAVNRPDKLNEIPPGEYKGKKFISTKSMLLLPTPSNNRKGFLDDIQALVEILLRTGELTLTPIQWERSSGGSGSMTIIVDKELPPYLSAQFPVRVQGVVISVESSAFRPYSQRTPTRRRL
jgi:hypothetical protein